MRNIDGKLTLIDSAQVFHWEETENGYTAAVNGRIMTDRDEDEEAQTYFDDQRDYNAVADRCRGIPEAETAIKMLPGLRVLNQPCWEALIAFILSSNNNVKRIRSLVLSLCKNYGDRYTYRSREFYGFPGAETLCEVPIDELAQRVKCGYRAQYLVKSAQMVKQGFDLEILKELPLEKARTELAKLSGVGPKVADCVLLFGCRHSDAFPVDIWVKRLMEKWFHETGSVQYLRDRARQILGSECGLIQQAMFHAARTGMIDLE